MRWIQLMTRKPQPQAWWRRLGWMVIIWCGSVIALFIVASLFRGLMASAGLNLH